MGVFGYVCEGDWRIAGSLRRRAAQQVAARDEQIGQSAGHQQTVGVLVEPAIAHLGEAKHPLDDPDRMFDPGPDLRLGAIFRPLDLIHDAAVAVTPIGEILGFWRAAGSPRAGRDKPDRPTLGSPYHATDRATLCCRRYWPGWRPPRGSACCGCRRQDAPSCQSTTDCPSWSDASGSRALLAFLVEDGALMIVASTIVPVATFSPLAARCRWTSSNSRRPRSFASSRWRKRHTVVSSGTGSRPRSTPTKPRIARES